VGGAAWQVVHGGWGGGEVECGGWGAGEEGRREDLLPPLPPGRARAAAAEKSSGGRWKDLGPLPSGGAQAAACQEELGQHRWDGLGRASRGNESANMFSMVCFQLLPIQNEMFQLYTFVMSNMTAIFLSVSFLSCRRLNLKEECRRTSRASAAATPNAHAAA